MERILEAVDARLAGARPAKVVAGTVAAVLAAQAAPVVWRTVQQHGVAGACTLVALKLAKTLPGTSGMVERETAKMHADMERQVLGAVDQGERRQELPAEGVPEDELFKRLAEWSEVEEGIWGAGRVSGTVYHGGAQLKALASRAYSMFSLANPLHPDVFPYVRKMEAEVVRMTVSLFHGDADACGVMTSGGTESILMAMKAYRDRGRAERGIETPEVVLPDTAHAAFDKAAHYFGMRLVKVPVDPETTRADVRAMERAITPRTVVLVGSAPAYPHGCIDPIEELAEVARRRGVALHVDACLGGFLLPFLPEAGFELPPFDFAVDGVTSMSADPHKYGFAPKGCSVVMYRSAALRQHQYFAAPDWPGGIYASPSVAGSRPGGLIAGCWATFMAVGRAGYVEVARSIMTTAKAIERGVRERFQGELRMMGRPDASVVAFAATDGGLDVYKVAEAMGKRGWNLNSLQFPRSVHLCLTRMTAGRAGEFLDHLRESVDEVKARPDAYSDGSAAMYGMAASVPDRSMVSDLAKAFIDTLYKV